MRAVPGPRISMPICNKCIDFCLRKGISRFNSGTTRKTMEHLIDHSPMITAIRI
jgi:hypothetical protein